MTDQLDIRDAEKSFADHEHREIRATVDEIDALATKVDWMSPTELMASLSRIRNWYDVVLGPHAAWVDQVLYPELDEIAGTPWATKTMRFEHRQIARAARQLDADIETLSGEIHDAQACAMRVHLGAFAALLRSHMERENEFLLPLLGQLDRSRA